MFGLAQPTTKVHEQEKILNSPRLGPLGSSLPLSRTFLPVFLTCLIRIPAASLPFSHSGRIRAASLSFKTVSLPHPCLKYSQSNATSQRPARLPQRGDNVIPDRLGTTTSLPHSLSLHATWQHPELSNLKVQRHTAKLYSGLVRAGLPLRLLLLILAKYCAIVEKRNNGSNYSCSPELRFSQGCT